jgi:hypothetical protein
MRRLGSNGVKRMNNKTTKTKKQHFIPQSLLKNWSSDGKHIKCIMFNDDRTIKTVCQLVSDAFEVSYLYGKSFKFEDALFANNIEPNFSSAIGELRIKKCVHDKRIQDYILYQMCRTKFVVNNCSRNNKIMSDTCFDEDKAREAGVSKEDVRCFIEDEHGRNIGYKDALENMVLPAIKPFICSLRKQKLIHSDVDLFIGENPVIVICPLDNQKLIGSIVEPCTIVLFPISPKEIIALYRPEDCEIKDGYTFSKDEAICFNSFQIQQTDLYIACQNDFDEKEYKSYFKDGHDHKIMTFSNGIKIFHTWQDLHYSGLDSCFRNIFYPKLNTYFEINRKNGSSYLFGD